MAKEKFSLENLSQLSKEKMAREEEITEKLKKLPRLSKKAIAREEEITEKLKKLPHTKSRAGKETEEVLEELRIGEKEAMAKQKTEASYKAKKKGALEQKEAGWNEAIKEAKKRLEEPEEIEVSDENIISAEDIDDKESGRNKNLLRHLRANLLDYPELLQPEIKKNLQIIAKQENVIEQNKGNAKKTAQNKIKQAKEIIERAQAAVDGYVNDLVKQYNTSHNLLMEKSRELYGEQKPGKKQATGGLEQKIITLGDGAGLEKGGLFGIKGFFRDRKLKKELGDKWDEFEVMRGEYQDKVRFYNQRLASHTKRFGRLEETLEAGTTFQVASRGGSERLPGVRGR